MANVNGTVTSSGRYQSLHKEKRTTKVGIQRVELWVADKTVLFSYALVMLDKIVASISALLMY